MRIIAITLAAACLAVTFGCSAFQPGTQGVTISATVSDVDISINGNYVGKTPVSTQVQRNRDLSIMAQKEGYIPVAKQLNNHLNDYGVIDVVGCFFCLFPGVGLLTPGAWSLDETTIIFQMIPETDPYWRGQPTNSNQAVQEAPSTNSPDPQQ